MLIRRRKRTTRVAEHMHRVDENRIPRQALTCTQSKAKEDQEDKGSPGVIR